MKIKILSVLVVFLITSLMFSQENLYSAFSIPLNLKENANAVIRMHDVKVDMKSFNEMHITEKKIITVLNSKGETHIDAYIHYDDNIKIKGLEVLVFNKQGTQIKKIKMHDFKDASAISGGTLYSDSRVKFLDYTPVSYPYTIELISKIVNNNTAFIKSFQPLNGYYLSVENSSYTIAYPKNVTIITKEKNFGDLELIKSETLGLYHYEVNHIKAVKKENYSPLFDDMVPKVMIASTEFALEGVSAHIENWDDFGKWMYHDLIKDTHDLPAKTVNTIQELVKDETNAIDKAKKVYQYVQDKTRYISVQVGIGGWKPFRASKVDKLGYGDCKALTNYTMSLLKAVNVESNYTVVFAGKSQRNMEKDFAAMQGNHVILNIPVENDEDIWLECTNQKLPFGFIGDFTDDRDVLVITPQGGKIKHTKKYLLNENEQIIKGKYSLSNQGTINVNVNIVSKGIQYDDKYWLETKTKRDLDKQYKKRWKYINGMSISNMKIENDKQNIKFNENVSFLAPNYSKIIGDRMLLTINALNRNSHIPNRYRDRKFPLLIKRGFKDIDEIEISLPKDYKLEGLPAKSNIESKFGNYSFEINVKDKNTLVYKREFVIKDGAFPKEDYNAFRDFYKKVSKLDNTKVVLIKNNI
ncbi:DUF3857 domain-containing protein [uncultured Algibacter sp.]|uniref:DUF3857 domain-containing protein n=1 Tax=uncultured Algibacter sp. TaxID=298659 RepID=UPI0032171A00